MHRKSYPFLPQKVADEGGRLLHDWCLEIGMLEEDSEVFDSETVAHWAKMADEILADFLKVLSRHGSEATNVLAAETIQSHKRLSPELSAAVIGV